jgi:hypothetical protein
VVSAKVTSHIAQITAAGIILAGLICKGLRIVDLSMSDILTGAAGIAGVFSPVYASLLTDKIKGADRQEKRRKPEWKGDV